MEFFLNSVSLSKHPLLSSIKIIDYFVEQGSESLENLGSIFDLLVLRYVVDYEKCFQVLINYCKYVKKDSLSSREIIYRVFSKVADSMSLFFELCKKNECDYVLFFRKDEFLMRDREYLELCILHNWKVLIPLYWDCDEYFTTFLCSANRADNYIISRNYIAFFNLLLYSRDFLGIIKEDCIYDSAIGEVLFYKERNEYPVFDRVISKYKMNHNSSLKSFIGSSFISYMPEKSEGYLKYYSQIFSSGIEVSPSMSHEFMRPNLNISNINSFCLIETKKTLSIGHFVVFENEPSIITSKLLSQGVLEHDHKINTSEPFYSESRKDTEYMYDSVKNCNKSFVLTSSFVFQIQSHSRDSYLKASTPSQVANQNALRSVIFHQPQSEGKQQNSFSIIDYLLVLVVIIMFLFSLYIHNKYFYFITFVIQLIVVLLLKRTTITKTMKDNENFNV